MGYCGTYGCSRPNCNPMTPYGANRPEWITEFNKEVQNSSNKNYASLEVKLNKCIRSLSKIEKILKEKNG